MLNKGKILWCIWAGILVLLFLMSSTDLIIKEKKIEVYPISVIIEGDNDDYYVNFKKGMDQAAVEFHGDVSFITLYADHDQAQQMELVKREIRDGTRAVILAPVKPEEAVRELEDMNPGCPVILLGQSPDERGDLDTIGVDGREIGRLLGEAASKVPRDVPVYLFCRGLDYGNSARVYEGVRNVLDAQGYHYRLIERKNQDTYRQAIQETDSIGGGRITIIALDVQSLDQATRILEENTIYQGRVAELYGAGSTTSLLRALDQGVITGLTAYNQFDEGYLSVKQAVEAIQGTRQKQQTMLEAIYVDEDKLRDKTYEKMLYPIE
uniref:substrate-binding domain-containing protein n=1 Tax=Enterocloster clostridioformis TaxID=1531 RepID=UPI0025A60545|nr:substrate-binding domain-containing protein [Enterocloster clostridioformis]